MLPIIALGNPWFEKRIKRGCSRYVNLAKSNWLNFRPVPTLDQGPVGLCYAYSAATLLDTYRDIHGLKLGNIKPMPSDPIWAAMLYYAAYQNEAKSFDGGLGEVAINQVRRYGMCRADIIEKAMSEYSIANNITTRDWYVITEWFLEFYNKKIEKEIELASDKAKKLKEIFSRYHSRKRIAHVFENGNFLKIYKSMKPFLKSKNFMAYMKTVFKDCFTPTGVYLTSKRLPPIKSNYGKRYLEIDVVRELNKNNPVLLTYKGSVLTSPSNFLTRSVHFFQRTNHQSVIIGKRVRGGKCQFLLKNTWGNYCRYNKDWNCYKDMLGREIGIWINANDLMKASDGIHYFDLSKKMKRFK
jgi:uncharacterized protein YktA (UPF0223 family)